MPQMPPGSFYKPKFFDYMKEEFLACREGVGLIDMSSFSKIEIKVNTCSLFTSVINLLLSLKDCKSSITYRGCVQMKLISPLGP